MRDERRTAKAIPAVAHAAVAVTEGLLRVLNREELEGVLAHEFAHVRNRDTLVMAIAATLAGALSTLANMAMWAGMLGGSRSAGERDGESGPFAGLVGILMAMYRTGYRLAA